jgi:hypothetical protein
VSQAYALVSRSENEARVSDISRGWLVAGFDAIRSGGPWHVGRVMAASADEVGVTTFT